MTTPALKTRLELQDKHKAHPDSELRLEFLKPRVRVPVRNQMFVLKIFLSEFKCFLGKISMYLQRN